jgi:hypothetical protein
MTIVNITLLPEFKGVVGQFRRRVKAYKIMDRLMLIVLPNGLITVRHGDSSDSKD